jgi:fermentation-respiration switch protein FrsA (DUF1100 family)
VALVAVGLAAGGGVMRSLVERMIFQPSPGVDLSPEQVGLEGEDVFLESGEGVRIHAFWLPARGATRAILFLHGNAGNASHRLPNAAELVRLGAHVLLIDYRGYGRSEGRPTETGAYADAHAGLAHLLEDRGVREDRTILFGRSLGGVLAVELAQRRRLAGVILESTFTSVSDMARRVTGLPIGGLLRGTLDARSRITSVTAPVLMFHGDRDTIVPIELGRALYDAVPRPAGFVVIEGADHNDTTIVGGAPYFARIGEFLDEVAPESD